MMRTESECRTCEQVTRLHNDIQSVNRNSTSQRTHLDGVRMVDRTKRRYPACDHVEEVGMTDVEPMHQHTVKEHRASQSSTSTLDHLDYQESPQRCRSISQLMRCVHPPSHA